VKCLSRIRVAVIFVLVAFSSFPVTAQNTELRNVAPAAPQPMTANDAYAALTAVGVVREKDSPAIEIIVTKPVVPAIQQLEGPPRLVIDLAKTRLALKQKRINVQQLEINAIRADQFQANPPVTRVVVDLAESRSYSWSTIGNRVLIHLAPAPAASQPAPQPETPSVVGLSTGSEPSVVPVTSGNSGSAVLGSRVAAGSAITAGAETTVLKLARGGEVRVCPGTTVSLTSSQSGRDLMLGMSTGTLEAHYHLDAAADSILTPDFRILMPGPGDFDYAVSADAHGNTCVRALQGNSASIIISELMGDGSYQVKAHDELMIRNGRLDQVDTSGPFACGCPATTPPVLRASGAEPNVIPDAKVPSSMKLGGSGPQPEPSEQPIEPTPAPKPPSSQVSVAVTSPETAPLPPRGPSDMNVRIEAPLVYRATDPPPAPTAETERLPIMTVAPSQPKLQTLVLAPPAAQPARRNAKPGRRGFFGKLKGLFSAMFG
jgi:AMIN domain